MNNKTLAIVFGALLLIYLLTKVFSGNRERSFDPEIMKVDTAEVNKLIIHPAQGEEMFEISKTGNGWQLQRGNQQFQATSAAVGSLLSNLSSITAERVVTKNPERYKDYAVADEGGTRIELLNNQKKLADIVVGRFNFNQATRSGLSYIKKFDDQSVYSVDGFLSMSLSQGFDSYRNKILTSLTSTDLTKLTLEENGESKIIMKMDSSWQTASGEPLDSASVASYLNTVRSVSGATFVNDQSSVGDRIKGLKIEGNNMSAPVEIDCYTSRDTTHHFVIHSSTNSEGYFFSDSSGIYERVFQKFPQ
ncbi:MAG: DUF4340 domain-containing protein [Saprospiraceae bacterium]|nr:DUF4340 domain-containing protein [Saprospiraceae bacterium]